MVRQLPHQLAILPHQSIFCPTNIKRFQEALVLKMNYLDLSRTEPCIGSLLPNLALVGRVRWRMRMAGLSSTPEGSGPERYRLVLVAIRSVAVSHVSRTGQRTALTPDRARAVEPLRPCTFLPAGCVNTGPLSIHLGSS